MIIFPWGRAKPRVGIFASLYARFYISIVRLLDDNCADFEILKFGCLVDGFLLSIIDRYETMFVGKHLLNISCQEVYSANETSAVFLRNFIPFFFLKII